MFFEKWLAIEVLTVWVALILLANKNWKELFGNWGKGCQEMPRRFVNWEMFALLGVMI